MDRVALGFCALFILVAGLPTGKAVYRSGEAIVEQGGFKRPIEDCGDGWEPMCNEPF